MMPVEGSEFGPPLAIDTAVNPWLNGGQPVIGRVVSGMDLIDRAQDGWRVDVAVK